MCVDIHIEMDRVSLLASSYSDGLSTLTDARALMSRVSDLAQDLPTHEEIQLALDRVTQIDDVLSFAFRPEVIEAVGFSIPCVEAVQLIADTFGHGAFTVELGAGAGMWSGRLAATGLNVIATDILGLDELSTYGMSVGSRIGDARFFQLSADMAVELTSDEAVGYVLSWPSMAGWAAEAIERIPVGTKLALISEWSGGCTGDDRLFDFLEASFTQIGGCSVPQFFGIRDHLAIFERYR